MIWSGIKPARPVDLEASLPSVEQIEQELGEAEDKGWARAAKSAMKGVPSSVAIVAPALPHSLLVVGRQKSYGL